MDPRRAVPRTDAVLADPRLVAATGRVGSRLVKDAVQRAQQAVRRGELAPEAVVAAAVAELPEAATTMRPILNATGVVLHTNLGRAPLSPAAVEALAVATGYVDVEYDVGSGQRAVRGRGALEALRMAIPATEDVLVVNNGAAALVLAATTLARGREIVVSRGELVEIGDGFRIPDLVTSTGATLREVGTTNRTTLADYAGAVGPATGFVLKVHPSNFRVEGFTGAVGVAELATLGVPVVADIGSGLLAPDPLLPDEPDAAGWLTAGADLVTASGDKLLGGPQAGIVAGRAELVRRLRRHPLARALRVDKLTLAALEASVRGPATPAYRMLHADPDTLRRRAESLASELADHGVDVRCVPVEGAVGGGGAPGRPLPGWGVALPVPYAQALREGTPCVVARVERDRCLLDVRTVPAGRDGALRDAVLAIAKAAGNAGT